MTIDSTRWNIGDRLVRTKNGIFTRHHALIAGYDYGSGQLMVAENKDHYGVRLIPLYQFLREGKLMRVEPNYLSEREQKRVIDRINDRLGRAYNLMSYNCEHFVNDVLRGEVTSSQIAVGTGIAIGIGIALWSR